MTTAVVEEKLQHPVPIVRPEQVAELGRELIAEMQSVRELLDARAEALRDCRAVLDERQQKILKESQTIESGRNELSEEQRKFVADLEAREGRCKEWEVKLHETADGLEERLKELMTRRTELTAQSKKFEEERQAATEQAQKHAERELQLVAAMEEAEKRSTALAEERHQIEEASQELKRRLSQLESEMKTKRSSEIDNAKLKAELMSQQEQLRKDRETFARQIEVFKQREAEVNARFSTVDQHERELERKQWEVAAVRKEWDRKMADITRAQNSLAELQDQLRAELRKIGDPRDDLIPGYVLTSDGLSKDRPLVEGPQGEAERQARLSVERFQQLCGDAKRRAIGT